MRQFVFNKPKRQSSLKYIATLGMFLMLVLLSVLFPNALRSASHAVARPLWAVSGFVRGSFSTTVQFFRFKSSLISENTNLKNQVASLQLKQIDYDTVSRENADLKNLSALSVGTSRIVSRVLSKPPQSPYDTFVIDVGSAGEVSVGNNVYISDTVIIGTITSVSANSSVVSLFSTSGQKQEAADSRTGASFELLGKGGANFQVEVPKETDIALGDTFLYPNQSTSVLGNVYYIDENSQSSFKTIYLRIPGNVFSTQWAFIQKRIVDNVGSNL